jgi:hypothetical protein
LRKKKARRVAAAGPDCQQDPSLADYRFGAFLAGFFAVFFIALDRKAHV